MRVRGAGGADIQTTRCGQPHGEGSPGAGSRYPVRGEPARLRFMRLLILGAGAVGGYFGGRLAEAGADVTFLVRPARKAQLESQGLRLTSPFGDVTLPVRARLASEVDGDQDLVLLACKAYDLTAAMDAIAPAMSGRAGVLPFLNGVSHVATLEQRFGRGRVLGGTARIVASMTPDGVIQHLTKLSALAFGELDGTVSPRTLALLAACGRTSFESRISTDIRRDLWLKLTFLGTLAAMNSLMRASVGEIVRPRVPRCSLACSRRTPRSVAVKATRPTRRISRITANCSPRRTRLSRHHCCATLKAAPRSRQTICSASCSNAAGHTDSTTRCTPPRTRQQRLTNSGERPEGSAARSPGSRSIGAHLARGPGSACPSRASAAGRGTRDCRGVTNADARTT